MHIPLCMCMMMDLRVTGTFWSTSGHVASLLLLNFTTISFSFWMNHYANEEFLRLTGSFRQAGELTPDDPEECVPTVQDSELNLLKSGEVTWVLKTVHSRVWCMTPLALKPLLKHISSDRRMSVPLSLDDIAQFGDGTRELFIKSSSYSVITVAVGDCGPTISWMFSSEPKSISFSVVYRDSSDTPVEQSKVCVVHAHFCSCPKANYAERPNPGTLHYITASKSNLKPLYFWWDGDLCFFAWQKSFFPHEFTDYFTNNLQDGAFKLIGKAQKIMSRHQKTKWHCLLKLKMDPHDILRPVFKVIGCLYWKIDRYKNISEYPKLHGSHLYKQWSYI